MHFSRRMVFFALLGLFLTSAILGALISYNTSLAWSRLAVIAIGIALCIGFSVLPEQKAQSVASILPAILVVYFLLTNDWTSRLGKIVWLDPLLQWFATWQPQLPGWRLDSNSLGGVIAVLLPLQVAALSIKGKTRIWSGIALIGISAGGLLLSESRGAWLALVVVGGVAGVWQVSHRIASRRRFVQTAIFVSIFVLVLVVCVLVLNTSLSQNLLRIRRDRWNVWRNSLDLASDYPFTGLGLGAFTLAYSSYILLVHVPHTIHAHNLFLDIWLEQGLLGLLAFVGLIAVGVSNAPGSRWRIAALASLGVMLIHGFLDDPFYGYGGSAIPLLLVPLGVLARESEKAKARFPRRLAPVFAGALAMGVLLALFLPTTRAMIESNFGTVSQTRAELSVYHWPEWSIQDDLRRSPQIDLFPAIAHYQAALSANPMNGTANRRLGQIELSRGDYDSARRHLEAAYAFAPEQRAARQMLGESYAIAGEFEKAAALWKTIDLSNDQIAIRQWWYEHIGDKERAVRLQKVLVEINQ